EWFCEDRGMFSMTSLNRFRLPRNFGRTNRAAKNRDMPMAACGRCIHHSADECRMFFAGETSFR
ncbi:MAG: hypothetical protein MUP93_08080, partial [Pirellulales bacterium]|nr:hypothetical protein [Pirellulales bacterium]